jgi:hypothetical protein
MYKCNIRMDELGLQKIEKLLIFHYTMLLYNYIRIFIQSTH